MTSLVRLVQTVVTAALLVSALPAYGQSRMVDLDGHAVHVYTAGWEHAASGQPTVVFESGSTLPIEVWEPVLASVAEVAPVVAFDPPGVGQSEWDGARPTLEHVNTWLHRLLEVIEAPPPYVLVGHSWAGWLVRGYTGRYPDEVAGLVLVDPTPPHAASVAAFKDVGAGEEAQDEFNRMFEGLMRDAPPPMRAQQEVIKAYAEAGTDPEVPATPSVPVVVVLGGTYGDPPVPEELRPSFDTKAFLDAIKGRQIEAAVEWVRASPDGILVLAAQNGHCVQCEDPELVAWAVRRVLSLVQAEQQGR